MRSGNRVCDNPSCQDRLGQSNGSGSARPVSLTREDLQQIQRFQSLTEACEKKFPDFGQQSDGAYDIPSIYRDHLLQGLDVKAKKTAAITIYYSGLPLRREMTAKVWLLGFAPHPVYGLVAVRRGILPAWKQPLRSARRIFKQLLTLRKSLERRETHLASDTSLPSELTSHAIRELERAIDWMAIFPSGYPLKKLRQSFFSDDHPVYSPRGLAYVLSKLFREHAERPQRVYEIECRIAQIENRYLGANIAFHEGFGSHAVKKQIREMTRSKDSVEAGRWIRACLDYLG